MDSLEEPERNAHRMRYDEYLAAGYPIASGVIEGACRHLVKDRMERAGMRWVLSGAQPMINLRSIPISGLWDEFIAYRIQKETPISLFTIYRSHHVATRRLIHPSATAYARCVLSPSSVHTWLSPP